MRTIPIKKILNRFRKLLLVAKLFHLAEVQWKAFSDGLSHISQGIILFSMAAFFVPKLLIYLRIFLKRLLH